MIRRSDCRRWDVWGPECDRSDDISWRVADPILELVAIVVITGLAIITVVMKPCSEDNDIFGAESD